MNLYLTFVTFGKFQGAERVTFGTDSSFSQIRKSIKFNIMKTALQLCGTISKVEILSQIKSNILTNTLVAEASEPYADYYGGRPNEVKPNSIFLFTRNYHFLEEVLRFNHKIENCSLEKLNLATAIIYINGRQYPAIRLKFFPDYKHLVNIQECLLKQGVEFGSQISIQGKYRTDIHKVFELEEDEPGIFFDQVEAHKAYFTFPQKLSSAEFYEIFEKIKNSSSCRLFDAEQGSFIMNGKVQDMVRVYSEGLDIQLMGCIRQEFSKFFSAHKAIHRSYV